MAILAALAGPVRAQDLAAALAGVPDSIAARFDGPPVALAEVLADADGDLVPDALGQSVVVGGRALVASGQLHTHWTEVFIEDGTAGLRLLAASSAAHIARGDSLLVAGVLRFERGMAHIADPALVVVPARPREVRVARLNLAQTSLEAYEGRLVEVQGRVVSVVREEGREILLMLVDRELTQAFVYTDRPMPISFSGFKVEDYVRVRGIAGQFDPQPPFDGSYVIFPREPEDVKRLGLPPAFYRNAALGFVGLLALALVWAWALRRQVARRAAQLRASESRYAHLFDAAGDAVIVSDAEPPGHIIEVNRVARQALGFTAEEFARRDLAGLTAPGGVEGAQRHLEAARRGLEAFDTLHLRTRAGADVAFEVRTRSVVVNGRAVLLSLARDVSEREQFVRGLVEARDVAVRARAMAEQARKVSEAARRESEEAHAESEAARQESERARAEEAAARERAEEMARLKSAFLANMSHEIRTPLTAIIGFAEILREEVQGEHVELAETIAHGGQRLLGTLNSVLDLARLDAGREELHPEPLDLTNELRRGLALLEPLADRQDLALSLLANGPIPIRHDASALDRVVTNLVGNAIKFTKRGAVRVVLEPLPDVVRMHVQDTGVGIDEAFLPKLFEEFHQESEGIARSHEGTGLGLAISKRLVELMGGSVAVVSRKGIGTTFTVTLPYAGPEAAPEPPTGDGAAPPDGAGYAEHPFAVARPEYS